LLIRHKDTAGSFIKLSPRLSTLNTKIFSVYIFQRPAQKIAGRVSVYEFELRQARPQPLRFARISVIERLFYKPPGVSRSTALVELRRRNCPTTAWAARTLPAVAEFAVHPLVERDWLRPAAMACASVPYLTLTHASVPYSNMPGQHDAAICAHNNAKNFDIPFRASPAKL
jgi:hypothetical protein